MNKRQPDRQGAAEISAAPFSGFSAFQGGKETRNRRKARFCLPFSRERENIPRGKQGENQKKVLNFRKDCGKIHTITHLSPVMACAARRWRIT